MRPKNSKSKVEEVTSVEGDVSIIGEPNDSMEAKAREAEIVVQLQAFQDSTQRLLDTMDNNILLIDDSVREVRTARQIAAESNRMARRRMLREGNPDLKVAAK